MTDFDEIQKEIEEDDEYEEIQREIDEERQRDSFKEGIFVSTLLMATLALVVFFSIKFASYFQNFSHIYFSQIRVLGG